MGWLADLIKELPISSALQAKLEKVQADYDRLEKELSGLREQNAWLKAELDRLKAKGQLGELENRVLIFFSQSARDHLAQNIGPQFNVGAAKMEHVLTQLQAGGYLSSSYNMADGGKSYCLNDKGREYLVRNDLIR